MDIIFKNSENSKNPRRLLLILTDKIDSKSSDKYVALSNLSIYVHKKYEKSYAKAINLKYQLQREMINLNYSKYHILYQIFKIILSISSKNTKQC